jgi:hypothetical protein
MDKKATETWLRQGQICSENEGYMTALRNGVNEFRKFRPNFWTMFSIGLKLTKAYIGLLKNHLLIIRKNSNRLQIISECTAIRPKKSLTSDHGNQVHNRNIFHSGAVSHNKQKTQRKTIKGAYTEKWNELKYLWIQSIVSLLLYKQQEINFPKYISHKQQQMPNYNA